MPTRRGSPGTTQTGQAKGRLRTDDQGVRFVGGGRQRAEDLVAGRGPSSRVGGGVRRSAAASSRGDRRVDRRARHHPRRSTRSSGAGAGRARSRPAVVRHYTSRAGDPHRHLHLQINARVWAAGRWRGLHTVGVRDSLGAINGIGHAAVMCDPEFRAALAAHGYTLDPKSGEVVQLAPYVGRFSATHRGRSAQRRPVRSRVAHRPPAPGARPQAPAGLGPSRLGRSATRQGRPARRRRARPTLDRGAPRTRVPASPAGRMSPPGARIGALDRARHRRDRAEPPRQPAVGLERRRTFVVRSNNRSPRRRRRPPVRSAASSRKTSSPAPSRPASRSYPATTRPNTSVPSPHHRSSRSRSASPPASPLAPSSRPYPGGRSAGSGSTTLSSPPSPPSTATPSCSSSREPPGLGRRRCWRPPG